MRAPLIAGVLMLACVPVTLTAHDFWINKHGYKDLRTGVHCCGPNDCFRIDPNRIVATQNGWLLDGKELIPYEDTYGSEDKDFWRCQRSDGSRRCFFAPGVGS